MARARTALPNGVQALLVTSLPNIRYLTGFTGSNAQLLIADRPVFYTDGRYTQQSAEQVRDIERIVYGQGQSVWGSLRELLPARGIATLGIESAHMTVSERDRGRSLVPDVAFEPTEGVVETLRRRKTPDEIDAVRRAQGVAEAALTAVLRRWTGGTERELALQIEWAIRTGGAEALSFDVIVASGSHAALPHAEPRDVAIGTDTVLLCDIGAKVDGYCSDMTRTYFVGDPPDPLPKAHAAVVRAVEAAMATVRAGVRGADVDRAARDVLVTEGFGDAFVHSTGHGVGLEIHEGPRLGSASEDVLEAGDIVTIEPGVYLPGIGGIRVEDFVVVTADGCENLTALPRGTELPR